VTTDQRSDALARFHRTLVEEILRTRPAYLREPFTVAEIYQNLVPYRTHRDRIGVEMNGDYEDALLRLLSGQGEYLVLESEHARNEISAELLSPNPNTGLFREFAAVDVRLNPLRMPRDLPDPVTLADAFTPPDLELGVPEPPRAAPAHASAPSAPRSAPQPVAAGSACPWCRESLPLRDKLNFCPFCGADLHTHPCSTCGEELELGWRFCAVCGTPVGDAD
jgi:hypothetical protein